MLMVDRSKTGFPRVFGGLVLLVCLPLTAYADAGTPLMWAGMLHMFLGNALVGIFEGVILAWVFRLNPAHCVAVMIPANYFSAWVGALLLGCGITPLLGFNLYNTWHWIWGMVVVTFLLTLILEWPFVLFCLRKEPEKLKRSLWGNLLVNSVSYALLFGWYWMASGVTLYTKMNVVPPEEITLPHEGFVYFISETNGVRRFDFGSRQTLNVCPLKTDKDDRLFVRASKPDTNNWDILDSARRILVSSNLEVVAMPGRRDEHPTRDDGTWFNFGPAAKLAEESDWNFKTGFWPIEGFRGTNQKIGETIHFSLETPFVAWIVRSATHLPGDYVVFQLGENQICLFETSTKKVALLVRGQGPVVVLPKRS